MAFATREQLLGATTVPHETVHLTALGVDVIVRGMTGNERDAYESSCIQGRGKKRDINMLGMRAKLVAFCCVDANGHRLFTDADVDALGKVRGDVVDKLFSVAQRLSGITEEDLEALGKSSASLEVSPSSPSSSLVNSATPVAAS